MIGRRPKLAAVVLAAGHSSRMGQFKPHLPLGGRCALEHAIGVFHAAGIRDVIVVTGYRAQELTAALQSSKVRCTFNARFDEGMFSSIVAGLGSLSPETDACFVLPADVPLVRPSTIEGMAATYRKCRAAVVYPTFQGRRGHPPLIDRGLFASLLNSNGEGGLRQILAQHESQAEEVEVLDEGIHLDMDTPPDYARLQKLAENRHVLSQSECEALLAQRAVPEAVVRHSRAVAAIGIKIAVSVVEHGEKLNLALIEAGALLHDIAKGQSSHAQAGARILESLEFPKIARVIASHSTLSFRRLDEAAIVFLADKLVCGEEIVSLLQRFEPAFEKYRSDPSVLPLVKKRWHTAEKVAKAVEARCQTSIAEILGDAYPDRGEQGFAGPKPEGAEIGSTESVCPECLNRITAKRVREDGNVFLTKACPKHGSFKIILWRGEPSYESWAAESQRLAPPPVPAAEIQHGCPFDCGLCAGHRQQTCCVLLEVTQRCNLACPVCFAATPGAGADPDLKIIEGWLQMLLDAGGPFNIQLSGGEPTVRNDLPEIVVLARRIGFPFVQVNTNGVRIADDAHYLRQLKSAGLDCVFLQFDGTADYVYAQIRGRALFELKRRAIERCREEQLGVVLVPTLVPGINVHQIGDIIRFAIAHMPTVRAVHFQPVSYFGRYPGRPSDRDRITLPEVLRAIERQTEGELRVADFYPPSAENAHCSFQGKFVLQSSGKLRAAPRPKHPSCCGSGSEVSENLVRLGASCPETSAVKRARESVARQWSYPANDLGTPANAQVGADSLDAFLLSRQQNTLSISGMAFQDAWNLDLERLRECFIHVVSPDQRLVPLCAYNLTDAAGRALYRESAKKKPLPEAAHV